MTYRNSFVEIHLGNLGGRIVGHAPTARLHRTLNPPSGPRDLPGAVHRPEEVRAFEPSDGWFLRGALPTVKRVLHAEGIRFRIRDLRSPGRPIHAWELRGCTLRDYQEMVVAAALRRGIGLIDIGTGGGKTVLAAALIARIGRPTLYLVTTRTLLAQTRAEMRRLLGFEPGIVGDGEKRPDLVTIALPQVLAQPDSDLALWRDGILIFDEGHHAAASSWFHLIRRTDARYNFFLSAVPFREGRDQVVLDALTGPSLTGRAYSARYLIDHGYACPVEVRLERCKIRGEMTEKPFWKLYEEFVVRNEERNARIEVLAAAHVTRGESVLVLVDCKEHGAGLLARLGERAAFVHGDCSRPYLHETVSSFARGSLRCLIATSGLFQEGVSIDGIHALIQAGGLKSKVKVLQSVGRGMRRAPGKDRCVLHDFFDDDALGVFRRHSAQRLRVLRAEGFHVPAVPPLPARADLDEPIPATWSHIRGTKSFVLVDGDGRLHARGVCVAREAVPKRYCERCKGARHCAEGGKIQWLVDPA